MKTFPRNRWDVLGTNEKGPKLLTSRFWPA